MADDSPITITPRDRDLAIRTMLAEAGNQGDAGLAAVGNVILNRASVGRYGGNSVGGVVLAPNQFEPWSNGTAAAIDPSSPAYAHVGQIFDALAAGAANDNTNGATHFYSPGAQRALGRGAPSWGGSGGQQIGDQLFYAPDGRVGPGAPATQGDVLAAYTKPQTGSTPVASTPAIDPLKLYAKPGVVIDGTSATPSSPPPAAQPDVLTLYTKPVPAAQPAAAAPPSPQGAPGPLQAQPTDSSGASLAKNVATGLIKGAADIPGVVGNESNLADYLVARVDNALTGRPTQDTQNALAASRQPAPDDSWLQRLVKATDPRNLLPSGSDISNPLLAKTGEYVPTTTAGRAVQAAAETAAGSLAGVRVPGAGNPLTARLLSGAAAGGAISQGATDVTGDPLAGVAAAAIPSVAAKSGNALSSRLIGTVEPETAALARTARNQYGIPINAGQMSESPGVRFAASTSNRLPFSGAGADAADQQTAFNRAVSTTFGQPADKITPSVMAAAKDRIGQALDDVAAKTTIKVDPQFATDLTKTFSDAQSVLPQSELGPLKNQISNVFDTIDPQSGTISGDSYQALTRKGAPLDRAMNSSDPNVKFYAGQIREALDDAMERSAPPEVAAQLQQARSQYKNMKTVEDLVEKSPTGNISPALLMNETRKSFSNMAYGGGGDLGDLARIGQRFLKEPPSSGTAERSNVINMLANAGGLLGTAAGFGGAAAGGLPIEGQIASAAGLPATFAANRLLSGYLRSPGVTNALIDRSLGAPAVPGVPAFLANALVPASMLRTSRNVAPP